MEGSLKGTINKAVHGEEIHATQKTLLHSVTFMYRESSTDKVSNCSALVVPDVDLAELNQFISYIGRLTSPPGHAREWKGVNMPGNYKFEPKRHSYAGMD